MEKLYRYFGRLAKLKSHDPEMYESAVCKVMLVGTLIGTLLGLVGVCIAGIILFS